jgi:hypothetical protein
MCLPETREGIDGHTREWIMQLQNCPDFKFSAGCKSVRHKLLPASTQVYHKLIPAKTQVYYHYHLPANTQVYHFRKQLGQGWARTQVLPGLKRFAY